MAVTPPPYPAPGRATALGAPANSRGCLNSRRTAMLLSADFATPHRSAVLAYDAANEIGLGIVIARPTSPQGPAPRLLPAQPSAPAAAKTTAPVKAVPN